VVVLSSLDIKCTAEVILATITRTLPRYLNHLLEIIGTHGAPIGSVVVGASAS
jgi:hypothetical protein